MVEKRLEDGELSRTAVRGETVRPEPREPGEDFGAILDALPAMVGYWDAGLRNCFANRAYVEFFGLTPEEIHAQHARGHRVVLPQRHAGGRQRRGQAQGLLTPPNRARATYAVGASAMSSFRSSTSPWVAEAPRLHAVEKLRPARPQPRDHDGRTWFPRGDRRLHIDPLLVVEPAVGPVVVVPFLSADCSLSLQATVCSLGCAAAGLA